MTERKDGTGEPIEFDDVVKCPDVQALNLFMSKFLDERKLEGEERRKMYWALFYKWKEGEGVKP